MGENLTKSAGGVWVKGSGPVMIEAFNKYIKDYAKRDIKSIVLTVPPATGAIIWALELFQGKFPDIKTREKIIKAVEAKL